jgi:KDO2-lipid IV(A) lauroyltransferase
MKHRPKHVLEYWLLKGLFLVLRILPEGMALALGWLVAAFLFHVLHWRTAEADRRLQSVFGERFDAGERRRIAWRSLRNICFNAVEAARFGNMTEERVRRLPMHQTVRRLRELHGEIGPYVLAVPHMGNWDLFGVAVRQAGVPLFSIAQRQKNPLTNQLLVQARGSTGMDSVLNDENLVRKVVQRLKAGQVLAILPDVRARTKAFDVRFLNGNANLGGGVALFAQMARCPVYPVVFLRHGWNRHEGLLLDPIQADPTVDKKQDRARILQEVVSVLDRHIQAHPEQYFWFNKRWVLDPV